MLEYDVNEAKEVLGSHIEQADAKLKTTLESLDYVRDQQTTMEVNMARVYNWDVTRRRKIKHQATIKRLVSACVCMWFSAAQY